MGAYHIGAIKVSCDIAHPEIGVITGLGNQHIDLFKSQEAIVKTKSELFEALPTNGYGLINGECEWYLEAIENGRKGECKNFYVYGFNENFDIYAKNLFSSSDGSQFTYIDNKNTIVFDTQLLGKHNVLNLLPAIYISLQKGVLPVALQKVINGIAQIKGKLSLEKGFGGISFLNDSYNSNLNGFLSAIEVMSDFNQANKYILTRGIFELGIEKSDTYKKIIDSLSGTNIILYSIDEMFCELKKENNVKCIQSEDEFFKEVITCGDIETLVLLEGRLDPKFMNTIINSKVLISHGDSI
jgi:UDP-N-acetylmuramoyl-tripeptide--D-alanyl-D-alanine ligase